MTWKLCASAARSISAHVGRAALGFAKEELSTDYADYTDRIVSTIRVSEWIITVPRHTRSLDPICDADGTDPSVQSANELLEAVSATTDSRRAFRSIEAAEVSPSSLSVEIGEFCKLI